ncbi:hypothetical protein [Methyloversatilis sp.]|uniref:hypothetical protein n=1 Tax=Methyloversatilis sp. TaxID=2569862 RepID=UPI0035B3E49B
MEARIDALGQRIAALIDRLGASGYIFERPDEVFPGPDLGAAEAIRRIESTVGKLPLALKLFWLRVGSVDLSGSHPDWRASGYLDQLVVFPSAYAVAELDEYLDDQEERDSHDAPYVVVPIAPDYFHKANVSGGLPYSVSIPAVADDPPLNGTPTPETLLEHVSNALRFGGFPGLASCPGHTWPVAWLCQSTEG